MREIKFRAMINHKYPAYVWPFETKRKTRLSKKVKWVELFGMGCGDGPSWWCEPNGYGSCTRFSGEILRETVGEYTGLKDKNGVEIYEGDIAQWNVPHGAKAEVKFGQWDNGEHYEAHEFGYGFYLETHYLVRTKGHIRQGHLWDAPIYQVPEGSNHNQVEVIGNIYKEIK